MEQSIKSKGFEHRLLLIMWGLLLSLSAFAQQITVKGHVVDATGEPVIGASVIEGKSTNGTITDIDGNFSLNVSANSTLTISFVGYKTQTVSVPQTCYPIIPCVLPVRCIFIVFIGNILFP